MFLRSWLRSIPASSSAPKMPCKVRIVLLTTGLRIRSCISALTAPSFQGR